MKDLTEQIPDAAIDAGARVLAGLDEGEQWPSNADLGGGPTGTRDDEFRDGLREEVADVLAAALPHLHPVIETVEQLDALPDGSVIRSKEGDVWKRVDGLWYFPGLERGCGSEYIDYIFPATVLHMGGDDA